MAEVTVTPKTGRIRLKITATYTGHIMLVGPFGALGGAKRMAYDLIESGAVRSVIVQHLNRKTWKPAWSCLAGAAR